MKLHKGFTLIELLIVVAIIAVLVSILIPALQKTRKQAKFVYCQTNLKQLQMGMIYFIDEKKHEFFDYSDEIYMSILDPYVDNIDEVRFCPETYAKLTGPWSQPGGTYWGTAKEPWKWAIGPSGTHLGSYGFNGWLYKDDNQWVPDNERDHPFYSPSAVKFREEVPVFADCNWVDSWPDDDNIVDPALDLSLGDRHHGTSQYAMGRFLIDRHDLRIGVSFFDGHVEPVDLVDLWSLKWNAKFQATNDIPNKEIIMR